MPVKVARKWAEMMTKDRKPHLLILVTLAVLARKNSRGWPLLFDSCFIVIGDVLLL
jgi:hypothetical protein